MGATSFSGQSASNVSGLLAALVADPDFCTAVNACGGGSGSGVDRYVSAASVDAGTTTVRLTVANGTDVTVDVSPAVITTLGTPAGMAAVVAAIASGVGIKGTGAVGSPFEFAASELPLETAPTGVVTASAANPDGAVSSLAELGAALTNDDAITSGLVTENPDGTVNTVFSYPGGINATANSIRVINEQQAFSGTADAADSVTVYIPALSQHSSMTLTQLGAALISTGAIAADEVLPRKTQAEIDAMTGLLGGESFFNTTTSQAQYRVPGVSGGAPVMLVNSPGTYPTSFDMALNIERVHQMPVQAVDTELSFLSIGLTLPLATDVVRVRVFGTADGTGPVLAEATVSGITNVTTPTPIIFPSTVLIPAGQWSLSLLQTTGPFSVVAGRNDYIPGAAMQPFGVGDWDMSFELVTPTVTATWVPYGGVSTATPTPVVRLNAAQASLAPGIYDLDSSAGAFSITLADTVGEWEFHNTARTLATNNVTLLSGGTKTFTNPAGAQVLGDFVLDVDGQEVGVLHTEPGTTYRVSFASTSGASGGPAVVGGVVFGNGTTQVQDASMFFFDDATNRLGIGTNAPDSKLTIEGDGFTDPNTVAVRLTNNGVGGREYMLATRSDGGAGGRFAISDETSGAVRMTVGSNGFVGIGEEGPGARLHVKGDSNGDANQAATRYTNDGPGGRSFNVGTRGDGGGQRFYVSDETAGAERFSILNNGETYIGASANNQLIAGIPNAALNIQALGSQLGLNVRGVGGASVINIQAPTGGDATFISYKTDDGSAGAHAGAVQYVTFNNTILYTNTSDERLKEDTGEAPAGLEQLLDLKVRKYAWKRTGAVAEGFFAQELYEVVPGAVAPGTDEVHDDGSLVNPWGVDYSKLTPILVRAVQELSAKVDALTAQLEALS